jgi:ribose 5-phosphate isomerase A
MRRKIMSSSVTSASPDPAALARVAELALAELGASDRRLGLGTGRAAEAFIVALGRSRLSVEAVPTSDRSEQLAREQGIALTTLASGSLDVAFDGADEVDPEGRLTKGLGGAMLRERVVAAEAKRFVVLVTPEKLVARLGARSPLPVEVVPFALASARRRLESLAPRVEQRRRAAGDDAFLTDNGNFVLDLFAPDGGWSSPHELDRAVRSLPGVVDTGFFFGMADVVIVGDLDGARRLSFPR